jgi:hypothetical protein
LTSQGSSTITDYKKLFEEAQSRLGELSRRRVGDINAVREAVSSSARSGSWRLTVLVYAADDFITAKHARDLVNNASRLVAYGRQQRSSPGSEEFDAWVAWLLKGVLRYVFMADEAGDPKWRYLLGSSRKPAFASRASFRIAARDEVERVVEAMKALGAEDQALEQRVESGKYLLVNVVDCYLGDGRWASDVLNEALQKLGLKLARKVTLKGCKP